MPQLAEYNEKINQITVDVVPGFWADNPLSRRDQGKDFVEFTLERLGKTNVRCKYWIRSQKIRYKNQITKCIIRKILYFCIKYE